LEAHVESLEKQADLTALAERADSSSLIDLIVVTDSEAVLGIGGTSRDSSSFTSCLLFR
jgi:malic enzyme